MSMYTTGSIVSSDGIQIGYRQIGEGPGLILLHGGMQSSLDPTEIVGELSDSFTVYIPDRRGRGLSDSVGENYGIETECDDIEALVDATNARYIFGLSSGAVIALEAALTNPDLEWVAVYEPPLFMDQINPIWSERFDWEIAQGDIGNALLTLIDGIEGLPRPLRFVPKSLLAPLIGGLIRAYDRFRQTDGIPLRELILTQTYDNQIRRQTHPTLERFRDMTSDVLLFNGARVLPFSAQSLPS